MSSRQGFTLIELMIVILIIGILAALAVPRLQVLALKAEQAEAPAILKQICSLAEAAYTENRQWPNVPLAQLPGWADPDVDSFDFSYDEAKAFATPKSTANPNLKAASMDCATKVLTLG